MLKKTVVVKNKSGLHARPASIFVQIANKFDSEIMVKKDSQTVDGKSIMSLLTLEIGQGSVLELIARGEDAATAVRELENFLLKENIDDYETGKSPR